MKQQLSCVLFALGVVVGQTSPSMADEATKKIDDVTKPDPTAPIQSWTPAQQWMPGGGWGSDPRSDYGYGNLSGAVVLADELGDRLSHLGRASLLEKCFSKAKDDATAAIEWAVCGPDARALDLKKLEAELVAEGIGSESRAEVVAKAKEHLAKAQKVGAAVEAAAKDDPGLASLLKLGETARAEWAAFASKHRDAIARHVALKDGVRSGKSNHKAFAGCYEATQPAFAKLVKATKFPWDEQGDPLPFYVSYLVATPEGYITTVAYGACAWAHDASGESLYAAAANQPGGQARAGARSLTLAKLMDSSLQPKFADRALRLDTMRAEWKYGMKMTGVNEITAIMTPGQGTVAALKKDGDATLITFAGNTVDACLQWKETNRVGQISSNGSVTYQKTCVKRGKVANQTSAVKAPTRYIAGISPGVNIITVNQFPVVAWRGKKLTGVLGIAL